MTLAAIGTGETPRAAYQGDVILLKAIVRHGMISYEDGDVLQSEAGWRPTARQETAVENDLKSYPVHIVTFYRTGNGSVSYKYEKLKPSARTVDRGWCSIIEACCFCVWSFMVARWKRMVAACWSFMVACWEHTVAACLSFMVACWEQSVAACWSFRVACCKRVVAACWRCMVACWRCTVAFWGRMVACCRNVVHRFWNIYG